MAERQCVCHGHDTRKRHWSASLGFHTTNHQCFRILCVFSVNQSSLKNEETSFPSQTRKIKHVQDKKICPVFVHFDKVPCYINCLPVYFLLHISFKKKNKTKTNYGDEFPRHMMWWFSSYTCVVFLAWFFFFVIVLAYPLEISWALLA